MSAARPTRGRGEDGREATLRVRNLTTHLRLRTHGRTVRVVDDVSFDLFAGETLGIVGESGCGKTMTGRSILRLLPPRVASLDSRSKVIFAGRDLVEQNLVEQNLVEQNLVEQSERELCGIRGNRIAMMFQEPRACLNPVFTVGWQIDEALRCHTTKDARSRRSRVIELLGEVGIPEPEQRSSEFPHQFSGGMLQRVMLAMALACEPDVLIADEPTTALDVTLQAQVLDLMGRLTARLGMATILITHDLGVIAQVCDRVVVMYAGQVVEMAAVDDIFHRPLHPYTKALLDSNPRVVERRPGARLPVIEGAVPALEHLPTGCRFHPRCPLRQDRCATASPTIESRTDGREVRCHFPLEPSSSSTSGAGEVG